VAAWQTIENWEGFKIWAEPADWRRKGILKHVPFCYGTKPWFTIFFEALETHERSTTFEWFLMFSNGAKTSQDFEVDRCQKGDKPKEYRVGDRLLGFTGDTILGLRIPEQQRGFHTLYGFRVVAVEELVIAFLITALAGIVVWLLAYISGKLN
jgi:hypothetical protein